MTKGSAVELRMKELFRNKIPFIPLIGDYIISMGQEAAPLFHLIATDIAGMKELRALISPASLNLSIPPPSCTMMWSIWQRSEEESLRQLALGNQIVVLVGEYLFQCPPRSRPLRNQKIMEILSGATTRMTEGELLQLNRVGDPKS
jgi:octaprenyl-diphosphate synthase